MEFEAVALGVVTHQFGQLQRPFDSPGRPERSNLEWNDLRQAIINDLEKQLQKEISSQGAHWQSRVRNLRWAAEVVQRQMAMPWEWRSMPDVIEEIPDLKAKLTNAQGKLLRGGLVNTLKGVIDRARSKALGECSQRNRSNATHG